VRSGTWWTERRRRLSRGGASLVQGTLGTAGLQSSPAVAGEGEDDEAVSMRGSSGRAGDREAVRQRRRMVTKASCRAGARANGIAQKRGREVW
jgi:hypothetical protein